MQSIRINLTPRVIPGQRIAAIDEIKGVAILLVIIYHCCGVLGATNYIHGEIGVDLFLIVSGFTLAVGSAEMPVRRFFVRRFLRIYPTYWIALALLVWMLRHFHHYTVSSGSLWQHVVGVHAFSRLSYFTDISDPLWFISMIVAAYVVFACVRSRLDDLSFIFAAAGLLTLIAVVIYQDKGHTGGLISLAVRIPSFFAGVVAGRLLGSGTGEVKFSLLLGLGLSSFYYLTFFRGIACNYTIPAIGLIFVWLGLRRHLNIWPEGRVVLSGFAFLGVISYEVYLFHQAFIRDYNFVLLNSERYPSPNRWQLLAGIGVGLAITLAISLLTHLAMGRFYALFTTKLKPYAGTARA